MNSRGASELFSIDAAVMSASVSRTGVSPFTEPPGNCGTRAAAGLARVHRKSTSAPARGASPCVGEAHRIRPLPAGCARPPADGHAACDQPATTTAAPAAQLSRRAVSVLLDDGRRHALLTRED